MSAAQATQPAAEPIAIVYDGECPFCANYVKLLKLRAAVGGAVKLVDARSEDPVVKRVMDAGFDLDDGMALVDGETIYHGDEAINRIALMSTPSDAFNKLNARVFRSKRASRALYPVLRGGRNLALALMGRRKIGG